MSQVLKVLSLKSKIGGAYTGLSLCGRVFLRSYRFCRVAEKHVIAALANVLRASMGSLGTFCKTKIAILLYNQGLNSRISTRTFVWTAFLEYCTALQSSSLAAREKARARLAHHVVKHSTLSVFLHSLAVLVTPLNASTSLVLCNNLPSELRSPNTSFSLFAVLSWKYLGHPVRRPVEVSNKQQQQTTTTHFSFRDRTFVRWIQWFGWFRRVVQLDHSV